MKFQSRNHYIQVPFILITGFVVGTFFPIVIYFHQWWSKIFIDDFKELAVAFFIGILGGTCQLSIHFAKELNAYAKDSKTAILPTVYEGFGYLLKQIWGGIAAVIFVMATKLGFTSSFSNVDNIMHIEAIIVISFASGLNSFRILKWLASLLKDKIGD